MGGLLLFGCFFCIWTSFVLQGAPNVRNLDRFVNKHFNTRRPYLSLIGRPLMVLFVSRCFEGSLDVLDSESLSSSPSSMVVGTPSLAATEMIMFWRVFISVFNWFWLRLSCE